MGKQLPVASLLFDEWGVESRGVDHEHDEEARVGIGVERAAVAASCGSNEQWMNPTSARL